MLVINVCLSVCVYQLGGKKNIYSRVSGRTKVPELMRRCRFFFNYYYYLLLLLFFKTGLFQYCFKDI